MSNKMKRILSALLMLTMLFSSMPVMADEMVELTPEQIAELTGVDEGAPNPDEEPALQVEDPVSLDEEPVPQDEVPTVSDEKPIPQDEEPVILDEESILQDEEPVISDEELDIPDEEPILSDEKSIPQDEEPVIFDGNTPITDDVLADSDSGDILPDENPAEETGIPVPQTAQELADYVGLSPEELAAEFGMSEDELNDMSAEEIAVLYEQINAMMSGVAVMSVERSGDFTIENGMLTKYNGTDTDVVIPDIHRRSTQPAYPCQL